MSEKLRDKKCAQGFVIQFNRKVLPISLRLRPEVDDDVEYPAAQTTNQLRLARRRLLEVHSTQSTRFLIKGEIALGNIGIQPMRLKFAPAKASREKASAVLMRLQVDEESALQRSFGENHFARRQ